MLQKALPRKLALAPEAASLLYKGGFPRRGSNLCQKYAQRSIYLVQRELENYLLEETQLPVLVCDRGSLDGLAYWPVGLGDFFESLGTSRAVELSRYAWVIHLDTADAIYFSTENPVRIESQKEAMELNEKIKRAWDGHPQRIIIKNSEDFIEKISKAKRAVEMILAGKTLNEIQATF